MDFKIENFIASKNLHALTRTGLHKTAAALHGIDEITIKQAVAIIASKARQKRAEHQRIADGIAALAQLQGEKLAAPALSNWWPHMLKGLPVAALGGGIGYALAPNDPQQEQKAMQQGALLGLLGGTLHSLHKGM